MSGRRNRRRQQRQAEEYAGDHEQRRRTDVPGRDETTDELVLEGHDPFRPATAGRYLLRTGPREPECERLTAPSAAPGGYESLTRSSVDVRLDVAALGSLVLGTVTPSVLAAAGRLEAAPEVLARADACFHTGLAPFTMTEF